MHRTAGSKHQQLDSSFSKTFKPPGRHRHGFTISPDSTSGWVISAPEGRTVQLELGLNF